MKNDFAKTHLKLDSKNILLLFGLAWTVLDSIIQPLGAMLTSDIQFSIFISMALLTCVFFNVRWAMLLFCALAVGSVAVLVVDLARAPFDRGMPDAGIAAIAVYVILAAILVVLTDRGMKAAMKGKK